MEATKMSLWYVASFPLDQYQAWLNAAHFGQDMARVDTSFAHLSRAFREPFARNRKKKRVDTISYLVFRGSSANLSPTCTFLERYLSRRHLKSMPVDLDYIKPFMGFCTTLIYIFSFFQDITHIVVFVFTAWATICDPLRSISCTYLRQWSIDMCKAITNQSNTLDHWWSTLLQIFECQIWLATWSM